MEKLEAAIEADRLQEEIERMKKSIVSLEEDIRRSQKRIDQLKQEIETTEAEKEKYEKIRGSEELKNG
jgi:peptidoglycan hydrolase CwlO-like protein